MYWVYNTIQSDINYHGKQMDTQEAAHKGMCIKERLGFQRVLAVGNVLIKKINKINQQMSKKTPKPIHLHTQLLFWVFSSFQALFFFSPMYFTYDFFMMWQIFFPSYYKKG